MDPGFDRSQGNFHRFGNLGVTQLLFVEQDKRLTVFRPYGSQCPVDFLRKAGGRLLVWSIVRNLLNQPFPRWPAPPGGNRRPAAVARDRQKPGFECPLRIPAMKVPQDPHKGFLGSVLRILPLAKHSVAKSKDLPPKTIDQGQHR